MPMKVLRRFLTITISGLSTTTLGPTTVIPHERDHHERYNEQDNKIKNRVLDLERFLRGEETRGFSRDAAILAVGCDLRCAAVGGVPHVAAADAGAPATIQGAAGLAVLGLDPREAVAARGIW